MSSGNAEWRECDEDGEEEKSGRAEAEGGDCRRKDGRALRKGSLGSEGEKGVKRRRNSRRWKRVEGRSNDALSHAESRLDNRDRTAPLSRGAQNVVVVVVVFRRHWNISFRAHHLFAFAPLLSFSPLFSPPLLTTHWNHFETSTDFATCPASALPRPSPGPEVTTLMTGLRQRSTRPREPRPRTAFKASILINDRGARGKSKWRFHGTIRGLLPSIFLRCGGLTYRVMR